MTAERYHVIVGNIGIVYDGDNLETAIAQFNEYTQLSIEGYGRAAHEEVGLYKYVDECDAVAHVAGISGDESKEENLPPSHLLHAHISGFFNC